MTIADIIRTGTGSAGSNRSWRADSDSPSDPFAPYRLVKLYHYSTLMAVWRRYHRTGEIEVLSLSTGNGSVSDQGGMNTLFRTLSLPYYFSRAGGAEIIELCQCGRFTFPHQHAPACDGIGQAIMLGVK